MKKGISLLEMVVALAVAAIVVQMGAVSFHRLEPRYRLQAAVWEVVARLNQARFRAILEETPVRVRLSETRCGLEEWNEAAGVWQPGDGSVIQGVTVQANNTPIFYPGGTVSNLATIRLFNSSGAYKITLAITGRHKVTRL
jgi:prepilin-type N-terminal cleavage/methylation domain-containing protein